MSTVDISILDRAVSVSENAIANLNKKLARCETSKGYTDAFHKFETDINVRKSGKVGVIDVSDIPVQPLNEPTMRLDNNAEIEKIVDFVRQGVSSKATYNKDNKSTYLSFSNSDERGFVDEERSFKDIMSDLVTTEFLKHDSTMKSFLYIFIKLMSQSIKLYAQKEGIAENRIIFLYKGGNVLRYVLRQFIYEETGAVGDAIDEKFGQYFKKSDADFQINIDPGLDNMKEGMYDKVYEDMQLLAYHVLYRVRNVYLLTNLYTLDFEKLKPKFSKIILQKYLDTINKLDIVNDPNKKSPYYGAKFLKLIYGDVEVGDPLPDLPYKEYDQVSDNRDGDPEQSSILKSDVCKRDGSVRADIAIVSDKNKSGESELHIYKIPYIHRRKDNERLSSLEDAQTTQKYFEDVDRNEMYISWNNSLEFGGNVGQIIKFSLVRSKLNFKAIYKTPDGQNIDCINMGGEFIDISIPHRKGHESEHFFYNKHDNTYNPADLNPESHTTEFKLIYKEISTHFHSYSLKYFIYDLNKMLFAEHPFVWEDPKHEKRLYRLFIFIFIQTLYETNKKIGLEELQKINDVNVALGAYVNRLKHIELTKLRKYVKETRLPKNEVLDNMYKRIPTEINIKDINTEKFYYTFCKQLLENVYNLDTRPNINNDEYAAKFLKLLNTIAPILQSIQEILGTKMQMYAGNKLQQKRLFGINMMSGGNNVSDDDNKQIEFISAHTKEYIKCKTKYLNLKHKK